ncbi:MAG TPA: hypothetical protein P5123_09235 [Spirochaetota bacterium]|nr:hypothetical protein [Spirochaetota bacterium]
MNKIIRSLTWVGLIFLLCFLVACGGDDGKSENDNIPLKTIDITNAQNLFVTADISSRSDEKPTLYKITADGKVEKVSYFDENGKELSCVPNQDGYCDDSSPVYIQNINNNYIVILFGWPSNADYPEFGYLVRKSDGAVFGLGDAVPTGQGGNGFINGKKIQTDSSGNLYFIYYSYDYEKDCLRKINIEDPNKITSERYTPDIDNVHFFTVDSNGNVIYSASLSSSDGSVYYSRIKKTNGGIKDILYDYFAHWKGLDGSIYLSGWDNNNTIEKVTVDGAYNVTFSDYITNFYTTINSTDYYMTCGSAGSYLFKTADKIVIYETDYPVVMWEVDNGSNSPRAIDISAADISSVISATCSDNYYYIVGKSSGSVNFIKIDPTDGTTTTLLSSDLYYVTCFSVSSSNQITFNALRYSDGAKIIGKIDANGSGPYIVTIVDESINAEISVLERIN